MAGQGWLDDATLARLDRLLAQAHLSAAQLADLRAAWTLQIINMFESGLKQGLAPQQGGDEWQRNLRSASLQGARMLLENTLYAAMLAWAAGDGSAYDHALKGPLAFTFILPKVQDGGICPPAMSTFDGGESAGNDDLDLLRLLVAAARYRLAQGRDPVRIEDLIPRYLDAAFNAPGPSFRVVDWVRNEAAATTSSAALVAGRPIFYVARRMTLTPLRARVSYDAGFGRRDLTGLNEPTLVGGWLRYLDSSLGQALDLMSSRSVEVLTVRIIWPRTEDVDLGWLDGPGNLETRY
jgi:hypothetical protein